MIGILFLFLGSLVSAQTTGDILLLKEKFATKISLYQHKFDQAKELKFSVYEISNEVSLEACLEIQDKIEKAYSISPFNARYKEGKLFHGFCDRGDSNLDYFPKRFFFNELSASNQLGTPAKYGMKIESGNGTLSGEAYYLLNEKFQIIEENDKTFFSQTGRAFSYQIFSLDHAGDFYLNQFYANSEANPQNHQAFASADGMMPLSHQLLENNNSRHERMVTVRIYQMVDTKDWVSFDLIMTHAWSGSFYGYDDQLELSPKYSSLLSVYTYDEIEVCAQGFIRNADEVILFPSTLSTQAQCNDIW